MKKIILISLLLGFNLTFAQGGFKLEISLEGDNTMGIPVEYNNKIYLPVSTGFSNNEQFNGFFFKISNEGSIEQSINISENFYSVNPELTYVTSSGDIALFSFVKINPDSLLFDLQITFIDEDLNITNDVIYDFNVSVFSTPYIIEKSDNHIILSGYAFHYNSNMFDVYTYEFDESFNLLNPHWFNFTTSIFNFDGTQIPNTNDFLFAWWGGLGLPRLGVLVRTNEAFEIIAMDTIITGLNLEYNLKFLNDTAFLLSGKKDPDNIPPRDDDYWVVILDTNNFIHNSVVTGTIDTIDHPAARNLVLYQNGNIMGGFTKNAFLPMGAFPSWYGLVCLDDSLNVQWIKYYGDGTNWMLYWIMATSDGGCLMSGTRYDWNNSPNERHIMLVKVDSNGLITSVPDAPRNIVHEAIVYPNPGNDFVIIESGPQISGAEFLLYDLSGKLVLRIRLQTQTQRLSTSFLPSGLYLWNIQYHGKTIEQGKWTKE